MEKRDYLDEAVKNQYQDYKKKGLGKRAQPFLLSGLPKKTKNLLVVGVALGGGEEIEALNHFFPDYKVYGIDISERALKQQLKAELVHSDVADLRFEDNFFDGILCSAVMHEVFSYTNNGEKKVEKAIEEISRCLTKEGICAIREFFVPKEKSAKLICLTKEGEEFATKFIERFRKSFDASLKKGFKKLGKVIYADTILLNELMLHFRVFKDHFGDYEKFFDSKEIEERYLPLSIINYSEMIWEREMDIIRYDYVDFPNYYSPIEENYKILDSNNQEIKNRFGFVDIVFRKK